MSNKYLGANFYDTSLDINIIRYREERRESFIGFLYKVFLRHHAAEICPFILNNIEEKTYWGSNAEKVNLSTPQ